MQRLHTAQFCLYDIPEKAILCSCQGIGGQEEETDCKGARGTFWDDGNILHFGRDEDYVTVYMY